MLQLLVHQRPLQRLQIPKINELTTSTAASPGELKTGNSGAEPAEMVKGLGDGGTGGDQVAKNEKTAELLHEATQLLKTLRIPPSTPQLKVMQIGGLDHTEANRVLIDSGATHGLRPARDHDEWLKSTRTTVQLANGSTEAFRLKPGTKILLGHPEEAATWIVPMGGLTDLDFTRSGNQCQLRDDEGRQIDVQVIHGCPMISLADGQMILQWLEAHQVHQQRKLAMVRTLMNDESQVDQSKLDLEMALTLKLRQHFPDLPDEVMMRVVPYLEMVKAESFQSRLPWNRHKRRRLKKAKHVVIHLFSGPDQTYWDRRCASETTEVLCVDTTCSTPANLLDKNVYAYLVALWASGRVRSILGGPPCRTLTALRYQGDDGPGVLRTDEYPYGLPSLPPADTELVLNDSTLMFRFWSLLIMAEEFRPDDMPVTQFFMEQPEDPARYRSQQDVEQHKYFSIFRTREWQQLALAFNLQQYHFDQFPMGHPKRKPTCLATNVTEMQQLDNVRGAPPNEAELTNQFRSLPMGQRFETSSSWSAWAPGLKDAIAMTVSQRVQWLERELHVQRPPALRTLSSAALESWKLHYQHDHMPARRDCQHCVKTQARGRPHRRIQHPEAFTLAVDLSGRLSSGINQQRKQCRYLMVGVYTFPVTKSGKPLVEIDGMEPQDQPLPDLEEFTGENESAEEGDPLDEQDIDEAQGDGEDGGHLAQQSAIGSLEVWNRLVEQSQDVAVRNVTLVEVVEGRTAQHVLPALARMYSRLRQLGLPVVRLHTDRAREFTALPLRRWAQHRDIVLTMTSGDNYKANGRCEAEIGMVKRAVRTVLSSGGHNINWWPLIAVHVGERRFRAQLRSLGYPVGDLLKFGTRAYALRKWWHHQYEAWRDVREEVVVLGPDACSTLTTTNYFVQAIESGRYFFTDDVITPDYAAVDNGAPHDAQAGQPALAVHAPQPNLEGQAEIYLPERDEVSHPAGLGICPSRRLRQKTAPSLLNRLSMAPIEGEDNNIWEVDHNIWEFENLRRVDTPSWDKDTDDSSWTLETRSSPQAVLEEDSFGEEEGVPNNWCGGSSPVTPFQNQECFLRQMQHTLCQLVEEEMMQIDGTAEEQAWCLPIVTEVLVRKAAVEEELHQIKDHQSMVNDMAMNKEFLVTKTISNKEVWDNLQDWEASVRAEFEQLVNQKKAVQQMPRSQLQSLAQKRGLPIELLPGKMVHTRKANSGAYRSRAVVCGNYQEVSTEERYAGGADGCQIRAMIRTAALKEWCLAGTDIRVAFLNAPKRDATKITAMEVPTIFKRLGLAGPEDIWLIEKALYGLVSSPRDWCVHRDEVVPSLRWTRTVGGTEMKGQFVHSKDENLWRLIEVNSQTGDEHWVGLMSVYVDDIMIAANREVAQAAIGSIEKTWAISEVEWASEKPLRYCGFEVLADEGGDGFHVSQHMYEQELMTRWGITESLAFPAFKVTESDEEVENDINPNDVRTAQMLTGALLWVSTRTRPDLAFGVSAMSRLVTRNPAKAIEIGYVLLRYVKGNPGGTHYPRTVPGGDWGRRNQLKAKRHPKMLEVFSDISYGANADHRSIQGLVVFYAGVAIAWQCGAQPFVAHSTAEAELIAYCESLVVGKATEALLCAIWGEDINSNTFDRVIYGDNAAAIGLAHGVTTSSWRTRHLRIRASVLKEALSDTNVNPGGRWKLLHLKGTELVADGCTKPLLGQAFFRFIEDLGMRRPAFDGPSSTTESSSAGNNTALRALVLGGVLLSTAEGKSEDEVDEDFTPIWVAGAVLMTLGAIYAGQLLHSASKFCIKRLCACGKAPSIGQGQGVKKLQPLSLLRRRTSQWSLMRRQRL